MCGITGVVNINGKVVDPRKLKGMTDTLSHRGPDEEGFYINSFIDQAGNPKWHHSKGAGNVGLGHRRLSIIDLSTGQQPMANEDGTVWVVFNGEIYNFQEVRSELLALGHLFKTNSDTEIIIHGYEQWGEECVKRFRGMFAFAIWDETNKTLFAARDRLGIKPFYYYEDHERFIFGSEIKAIVTNSDLRTEVDPTAFFDYMCLLYIPSPKSIYKEIRKLPAGCTLTLKKGKPARIKKYWDLSFATVNHKLNEQQWCEKIITKLEEAVKIRLISEVPLGAFLSGGIDSSAVVALMAGLSGSPVKTSSIGFTESKYNELPYANQIVSRYGTEHNQEIMSADAVDLLEKLVWYYDEPFADSSAIPTYLVSKITSKHVTVALSGDGGDENFAGYRRYYFDRLENRLRCLFPDYLRKSVIAALAKVYPKADWAPQIFRAKTFLHNIAMSPMQGYFNSMSWFGPDKRRIISERYINKLSGYDPKKLFLKVGEQSDSQDPLSRIQYLDIKSYLVDDILTKVDRASMANSLEVRVPLLDHEFMELVATIPSGIKLKGKEGKYILKKSLEPLLPKNTLYRKKMGFSIPLAKWFRKDLKEIFQDVVLGEASINGEYINMKVVDEMWRSHQSGIRDYAAELWTILFFAVWMKNNGKY